MLPLLPLIMSAAPTLYDMLTGGDKPQISEAIKIVADKVGADANQPAIVQKLESMPDADKLLALQAAETTAQTKIKELGKTTRAEMKLYGKMITSKDWLVRWARPINLWAFSIESFALVMVACGGFIVDMFVPNAFDWDGYIRLIVSVKWILMSQAMVGGAWTLARTSEKKAEAGLASVDIGKALKSLVGK